MTMPIRLVLVDDHVIVREGLRHVLEEGPEYSIVGEGATAAEAIKLAAELKPDVMVLDISMPGGSGLHAVPEILERSPQTRVLMLSVHDDTEYIFPPLGSGGSNSGPTNPDFLKTVGDRVKALHDTGITGSVPADLVEASASGLDPHLSPAAALWQVPRVAKARGVSAERVRALVEEQLEGRDLGVLGEPRVNVLLLNLALDRRFGAAAPAPNAGPTSPAAARGG